MENESTIPEKVPNFGRVAVLHGMFGIIEYSLIVITIVNFITNFILLLVSSLVAGILFLVLAYTILFKNPFYYFPCIGLIILSLIPCSIALIFFIGRTVWSFEPLKVYVIIALLVFIPYIFITSMEVSHNKYISYFYQRHGGLRQNVLRASFYSVKEFDKLSKGRQYWQDRNPEEIQKMKDSKHEFEKRFKKKYLVWFTFLTVITFELLFFVSLGL